MPYYTILHHNIHGDRNAPPVSFSGLVIAKAKYDELEGYPKRRAKYSLHVSIHIIKTLKHAWHTGVHTLPHHTIPHCNIPYNTIPWMPYHMVLYHVIPLQFTPCHTILYHIIPYQTISYQIIPYPSKPYHNITITCHTTPCYTTLYRGAAVPLRQ